LTALARIHPGTEGGGNDSEALPVLQYVEKGSNGDWKITLQVNNTDVPEQVGGLQSTWFLSEKEEAAAR